MPRLPGDRTSRRVIARDDALALGHKLLQLVSDRSISVRIEHTARALTKVANGRLLNTDDGDQVKISFQSQLGSGLPVNISTNQFDDVALRAVVAKTAAMAPPKPPADDAAPIDYSDWERFTYQQQSFPPVALWHDTTIHAMDTVRGDVIPALIEQIRGSQLLGAATVGLTARSVLYLYKHGLTAFAEETDCEVTVTARTPDGTASGWAGQAHRDWAQLTPETVAARAGEIANRSRGMVALEPGRRTAILGPAAVAQLVRAMAPSFDWNQTNVVGGRGTPFTYTNHARTGRHTKFGMRVFDPRITMTSDPADPLGGFPPFFEEGSQVEANVLGFPTPAITWVDRGILTHLAYSVVDGLDRDMTPCDVPYAVRLMAAPGTPTATIEEMIANCKEGIYVNRFSQVSVVDGETGMMTGSTRDGCFLVKNGKIEKPVKNFRFLESPFFGFNNLEMIGMSERAAFGYAPKGRDSDWPLLPVIVPPMMIRDFNFSGLSDGV